MGENTSWKVSFAGAEGGDNGMNVVLVGAGNVATQLGMALKNAGHEIMQVYSRTGESAAALAEKLECPYTVRLDELSDKAELYLFSLKDAVCLKSASGVYISLTLTVPSIPELYESDLYTCIILLGTKCSKPTITSS